MEWFLAALSGILAGLSYPFKWGSFELLHLGPLAFVAWVPLFWALRLAAPRRAFALGFVSGMFHYAISQYWLYTAIHSFGGLSPAISVAVMILLFAILSSFFGLVFYLSQKICCKMRWQPFWVRPCAWIAIEYIRSHFPSGGYPWSQIGYSQIDFQTFIQSADIWAVYGITFLVVLVNEAIFSILLWVSKAKTIYQSHPSQKTILNRKNLIFVTLLILANYFYGRYQLSQVIPSNVEIPIGVVQGNISQDEKWDREMFDAIMTAYLTATHQLELQGAELVLWPEASWPKSLAYDVAVLPSFKDRHVDLLVGAISYAKTKNSDKGNERHNSAILVSGRGEVLDFYHKRQLVPFGEYVPFQEVLFFAKKLTAEVGDLKPGDAFRPIHWREYPLGILICYEDIFPDIARAMAAQGAVALINTTNDAWYGVSSAPLQHQVFSQFRSVETRLPLIRSANTGISSMINAKGEVLEQGPLFERKSFIFPLKIESNPKTTFYVRWGDWLCYLSILVTGVLWISSFFFQRQPEATA